MAKIRTTFLVAASLLTWLTPALSDDVKQSDAAPVAATNASSTTKSNIDHPHYPHDWIPGRGEIMGVSGITDKQRTDIRAIYDDSGPRFAALDLEYHDLRKQNWEKIQKVLTPDQVNAVLLVQHNKNHPDQPMTDIPSQPKAKKGDGGSKE
jgi:hypothetical protein